MTAPAAAVTPERDIAIDMARRALPLAPIPLVISAIFWQVDGVISSAYALVLIVANFLAAAAPIPDDDPVTIAVRPVSFNFPAFPIEDRGDTTRETPFWRSVRFGRSAGTRQSAPLP